MNIIKTTLLIYFLMIQSIAYAENNSFSDWVISFKKKAEKEGISTKTINTVMDKAIYLPKACFKPKFLDAAITPALWILNNFIFGSLNDLIKLSVSSIE